MKVNYSQLNEVISDNSNKGINASDHESIKSNMYPFSKEFFGYLEQISAYEVASLMQGAGHWQKSRRKIKEGNKPWKYNIRDIVFVNLGGNNYGYEASYQHPCVIYANLYDAVLVIPCSTGRYGVKSDFIIKGEKIHGFKNPTGIQLDKIRVIDKFRIQGSKLGRVTNGKFNEITNRMIELYFNPVKKRIDRLEEQIQALEEEKRKLVEENKTLKEQAGTENK